MALLAYDGASAFDLNVAKQHSGIAVTGYLVGHPGGFNPIDKNRVNQIRALGMGFVPNWERSADFFNTCTIADAQAAGAEGASACRALGLPADGTLRVPFSFDGYVQGNRFVEMGQKFNAVRTGLGTGFQAMIYGQYSLINYLVTTGHAPGKHWLSGSTYNEPYNPSGPNICMVQSHDAAGNWINTEVPGTDVNTVIDPHALGAWWPPGSPYGDDMSPADVAAINAHTDEMIFKLADGITARILAQSTDASAVRINGQTAAAFQATADQLHAEVTIPVVAAVKAAQVPVVDVNALAAALAPLLSGVTKDELVAVINSTQLHSTG